MTHLAIKNLTICLAYGIVSIFQTLNSRFLYRNLKFDFYSFVKLSMTYRFLEFKELPLCLYSTYALKAI